jgi:uncharacterized membrane protein HdeD (DUF308 family)
VGSTGRDVRARRRRGLLFGGVGIVLLFVPAVVLILSPGASSVYAIAAMVAGIVLLVAGFIALPGSLQTRLRPKP